MQKFSQSKQVEIRALSVADPDVELTGVGGGGGLFLFALPAFPSSVIFFIFYPRKGGGPPGPSSRSATGVSSIKHHYSNPARYLLSVRV